MMYGLTDILCDWFKESKKGFFSAMASIPIVLAGCWLVINLLIILGD